MHCKDCKFWNNSKPLSEFDISEDKKYSWTKHPCEKIRELAEDTGYETEGIETDRNFGCILFENKLD